MSKTAIEKAKAWALCAKQGREEWIRDNQLHAITWALIAIAEALQPIHTIQIRESPLFTDDNIWVDILEDKHEPATDRQDGEGAGIGQGEGGDG